LRWNDYELQKCSNVLDEVRKGCPLQQTVLILQKKVKRIMNVSAGEKFSESGSFDEIDESCKWNKTASDQLKKYCNLTAGTHNC